MSVRLNPCFGCPLRDGCDLREGWRKRVHGLGLRSATFDCPRLKAEIRPGRRIEIIVPYMIELRTHNYYDSPPEEEPIMADKVVTASVTAALTGHRFVCTIDPGQISNEELSPTVRTDANGVRFRCKMRHSRIVRFLDEPDAMICPAKSHVVRDGFCDKPHGNTDKQICTNGGWL